MPCGSSWGSRRSRARYMRVAAGLYATTALGLELLSMANIIIVPEGLPEQNVRCLQPNDRFGKFLPELEMPWFALIKLINHIVSQNTLNQLDDFVDLVGHDRSDCDAC